MTENKPTHRRHNPWHDYTEACIYHITIVVRDRKKLLGEIVGDSAERAMVEFTPLGREVSRAIQRIPEMEALKGNEVQILGAVVMPEHIHFVLYVRKAMEQKLGMIIRGFKQGCNKRLRAWLEKATGEGTGLGKSLIPNGDGNDHSQALASANGDGNDSRQAGPIPNGDGNSHSQALASANGDGNDSHKAGPIPNGDGNDGTNGTTPASEAGGLQGCAMSLSGMQSFPNSPTPLSPKEAAFLSKLASCGSQQILENHSLFEDDFDETRLRRKGQLQTMINYVHNNPRHRWMKRKNRDCFIPVRGIEIAGRRYDAIGNMMLLGLRRFQVHCRYKWEKDNDTEARRAHQNECVKKARENYALVSPFIMDHEKAVLDFCLKEGHSAIVLMDNGFTDFTTCPGGLFEYCDRGQVLLLVPSELPHIDRKGTISRAECKTLNERAEEIAKE